MPRAIRASVLILTILALLGLSVASASPAHLHEGSSPNTCNVCGPAHLVLEMPAAQPLLGPELQGRTTLLLAFFGYQPHVRERFCSRGPPASK